MTKMTVQEVKELNKGRYKFKTKPTSSKYGGYRKLPGHVLVEDFLVPFYPAQLSDLAKRTGIPFSRLKKLIRGNDRIDATMAEALGEFYKNGAQFWLDLQEKYERGDKL